jgi:hypothetical protein
MKKRVLLIGSICCRLYFAPAQPPDSSTFAVSQTEVALLYNQYEQDGDRSAVTGGRGTERLTVYGPSLSVRHRWGKHTVAVNGGSDLITSASTDRIDFVMSSASRHDARTHGDVQYTREISQAGLSADLGVGASIESDYFSFHQTLGLTRRSPDDLRQYAAQLQLYQDDLRWGRLDWGEWRPQKLIYPRELRGQTWYDTYQRRSLLLNVSYTQVLDQRNMLGLFALLGQQAGLLATPFHRVYFSDSTVAVEQLPGQRQKASLAVKWHRFVGGKLIVKSSVDGYTDSFGVLALALALETAIKLRPQWTLRPSGRLYTQRGARAYAPYGSHEPGARFYTSDPDLSGFQSLELGVGGSFRPYQPWGKRGSFESVSLAYRFYARSNGLRAHVMSLTIKVLRKGKPKANR